MNTLNLGNGSTPLTQSPPVEFSGERRTERRKYDGRKQPEHGHERGTYQTRHAGTLQKFKWGGRNSSIELLRIIAMFMILAHHFIVHNGYDVLKLPLGPERIFFQLVMAGGGKVGVVIFFSISAWFFLDKEQTIKSNLKRVWIMERELLFWSLILVTFYLVFDRADLGMKLMVKSVMPLSMGLWWYATAYAIFLALLPFLAKGLKALGRKYHLALASTVLVIWGLTSFIPGMIGISDGFFGFIYLFILISAYKWYLRPLSIKQTWALTAVGVGFVLLYTAASTVLGLFGINKGIFITGDWKLPVVMIGFGMFLLFDRVTFHSRIINRIAQSAFAVYLITDYAASEKPLWTRLFNLQDLYQQPLAILQILGILLAIYAICTLLDFIRQALSAVTIDRRRGHWFDLLWNKASN